MAGGPQRASIGATARPRTNELTGGRPGVARTEQRPHSYGRCVVPRSSVAPMLSAIPCQNDASRFFARAPELRHSSYKYIKHWENLLSFPFHTTAEPVFGIMADSVVDEEKGIDQGVTTQPADGSLSFESSTPRSESDGLFKRLNDRILSIQYLEKRGFERVPVSERHTITRAKYVQMTLLWFSSNITANNIAVGMLGPLAYDLGFTDSALCAAFGAVIGSAGAAYMSTFGPESGNRTMVSTPRYGSTICAWC